MKYLSMDLESTGLEEDCYLIQLAFVPVDAEEGKVRKDLSVEYWVHCPPFEELKPKLNAWVVKHNEGLIRKANEEGISQSELQEKLTAYLESAPIKTFFSNQRPKLLGKSMTALDIPMLNRYLGGPFMRTRFHHHTADVTCIAHAMVDSGILPKGHASGSKLINYLNIRDHVKHTAMEDALDMGESYLKLVQILKKLNAEVSPQSSDTQTP